MTDQAHTTDLLDDAVAKRIREEAAAEQAAYINALGVSKEAVMKMRHRHRSDQYKDDLHRKATEGHTGEAPKPYVPPPPRIAQYHNVKGAFWLSYQRSYRGTKGKGAQADPQLSDRQKALLPLIITYLISWDQTAVQQPDNALDPHKGLYIYGDYGTGKTLLLQTIRAFLKSNYGKADNMPLLKKFMYFKDIQERYRRNVDIVGHHYQGSMMIDDLGFKGEGQLQIFGNKINLVSDIIDARYNLWRSKGHRTMCSSNLTLSEIDELHGGGISGRIAEMCNIIEWNGPNHRLSDIKSY